MNSLAQTFLRRPAGVVAIAADGVRLLAIASVLVAGIGWGAVQASIFMLALLGALAPRALGIRPSVDLGIVLIALLAAWSNIFDLYTEVFGWDKLVHVALTAAVTVIVMAAAQQTGSLRPTFHGPTVIALATAIGLALGSIWEMLEWAGYTFTDAVVFVGYDDTIGDLMADGVGGLIAGLLLPTATARGRAGSAIVATQPSERTSAGELR
ncbi:hypothetical protein [Agromyces aureus]|uniref:Membrane-spanning protein n=1 Tax=Agromyces aureus TaxID=453304 RepID=A0A191WG11_9MICO|nr:hypothetical protein [Agromyces aureus]ANJ27119.1 hypothetical protein ATC03_10645 [Agromyces aureus]